MLAQLIKNYRLNHLKQSMRQFCLSRQIKPNYWCMVELGFCRPASFQELVTFLLLKAEQKEYKEFKYAYDNFTPVDLTEERLQGLMPHPILSNLSEEKRLQIKEEIRNMILSHQ